ncbi:heavy-metal-associated domain-containing protein [Weeksellaceae bacterium KMM 9713]|uniref:Heavy-metal-associated domain-containing protein n=1 Tax=Profundicola chukchiensis TaxID=2961959 RepID=A0A9X4MWU7_9FLAO|nr:heavy metal-associated domain-containing protein [Profundicola chukchiensis]MDG4946356.1 heavy-metal-associated domain-containing protein [Profundicola chukchiensis]
MKKSFKIDGMTCEGCVQKVQDTFSEIEGVQTVKVSLKDATADIEANNDITMQQLQDAIDAKGGNYEVSEG